MLDLREAYTAFPNQSEGFIKDLNWWKYQSEHWNGISILDHSQRKGIVTLDASKYGELGSKPGLGAYNLETHKFYYRPVPDHIWLTGTLVTWSWSTTWLLPGCGVLPGLGLKLLDIRINSLPYTSSGMGGHCYSSGWTLPGSSPA